MSRKNGYYVDKKKLYEEVVLYHEKLKVNPNAKANDYIGDAIIKISTKIANMPKFSGYTYKDEMIDEAIVTCVKAIRTFDVTRSSEVFSYLTTTVQNTYWSIRKKEKRQADLKTEMVKNHMLVALVENNGNDYFNLDSIANEYLDGKDNELYNTGRGDE